MELARRIGGEILSVDSMQVYRGMDVGTAKPTALEQSEIRHHMIDIVEPSEDFSVAEFQNKARAALGDLSGPVIVAGGSGLHFRSVVDPMSFAPTDAELRAELESTDLSQLVSELERLDSEAVGHVDMANKRRVVRAVEIARLGAGTPSERAATAEAERLRRYAADIPFTGFGLDPGDELESRVARRLGHMRSGGLVEEVARLRGTLGRTAGAAVGYREIAAMLDGDIDEDAAFQLIEQNTNRLARKQRTWFQRDPRIRWIPWSSERDELVARIESELM